VPPFIKIHLYFYISQNNFAVRIAIEGGGMPDNDSKSKREALEEAIEKLNELTRETTIRPYHNYYGYDTSHTSLIL
jgi:hypothetical protein